MFLQDNISSDTQLSNVARTASCVKSENAARKTQWCSSGVNPRAQDGEDTPSPLRNLSLRTYTVAWFSHLVKCIRLF